jgi:hypothetical protein
MHVLPLPASRTLSYLDAKSNLMQVPGLVKLYDGAHQSLLLVATLLTLNSSKLSLNRSSDLISVSERVRHPTAGRAPSWTFLDI